MLILKQFGHMAFLRSLLIFLLVAPNAYAAPLDCEKIKSLEKTESFQASPKDIAQCQLRGFDPPTGWKLNEGKNSGIRASGASGFSYGAVSAPEASPGARKKNASVRHNRMKAVCKFPPRIKIGFPPRLEFPKGACYDVFNDLMNDKDGRVASAPLPAGINATDTCPAETDNTGIYGVKSAITSGGTLPNSVTSCGGMIPTSFSELTLNANPTMVAITDNGRFGIRIFKKSGTNFVLTQNVDASTFPSYLCEDRTFGDSSILQKSVDLTPPIAQVITFNEGTGKIAVRLQSRATMHSGLEPPYDENAPERYLIFSVDVWGNVEIPDQSSCPLEIQYFDVPATRQDIKIQPAVDYDCDSLSVEPTARNNARIECMDGSPADASGKCYDSDGNPAPTKNVDNWVAECPLNEDGSRSPVDPNTNKCPQSAGIPTATPLCPNGAAPVNGACSDSGLNAAGLGALPIEAPACGTASVNCQMITIGVSGAFAGCSTKQQYAVLNRPNIYYPAGSAVVLNKLALGQYGFMAESVAGTQYFTLGQTEIFLQSSSPAITFNEGGYIKLKDRSMLIMSPSATVTAGSGTVLMNGGGQLVSPGGIQLQSFADGATYAIPAGLLELPMSIRVNRSITLPAGFMIPTMPTFSNSKPAYFRQPIDSAPM
jgi:hypothetical protein